MPALTKTQLDHATKRLEEQKQAFIRRKLAVLGDEPEVPEYTDAEKTRMIRSGEAKLSLDYNAGSIFYGRHIGDFFDYPMTLEMSKAKAAYDDWKGAVRAIREEADRIMQGVLDELIMSPDGKAALDRIAVAFA